MENEPKSRYNPDPLDDGEIVPCDWGCCGSARYRFKNGRVCCEKAYQRCLKSKQRTAENLKKVGDDGLTHHQRNGHKAVASRKKIGEDGLSSYQRGGIKCSKTHLSVEANGLTKAANFVKGHTERMKEIGDDGLSGYQRSNQKTVAKRSEVGDDGINSYQRYGKIAYATALKSGARQADVERKRSLLDENGLNAFQRAGIKSHTNAERGEDGLTAYERATRRRIEGIDDRGLNGFEQAMLKAAWIQRYMDTDLYYQGNDELWFLDDLVEKRGIDWVKENVSRGPTIKYNDPFTGKPRNYFADFIIDDIVYEVKSSWTWGSKGNSERQYQKLLINRAKLSATLDSGYSVILVLDRKEIPYA